LAGNLTLPDVERIQHLLENAIKISPEFSDAMAQLAVVLAGKIGGFDDPDEISDYENAKIFVARSLSLSPNNAVAITAKGMLAALNRRCNDAIPTFQRALEIDPSNILAHKGLAGCALQLGQVRDMIDQVNLIRRLDPAGARDANRQHQLGMGYLMLGQAHEAVGWLNRAGAAIVDTPTTKTDLSWHEWRYLYLIAATWLDGDKAMASNLYKEYNKIWPRRSVWQMSSYDTHALSELPGYKKYCSALAASGMPVFNDEQTDLNVAAVSHPVQGSDMDPTPISISGARTITAKQLHELLAKNDPPTVIDLGRGASVVPGSKWVWSDNLWSDESATKAKILEVARKSSTRPVVIMSTGAFGWTSYNEVLELVLNGVQNVLWFRGGEEAWTAAGYPADDRRTP
jgi:tetratricopeptide (TPR) repeat protein